MLSPQTESFAAFVTRKRKEHNMTMRSLSNILGVSSPFNPSLLSDPAPVDIERFAESYLQLSIDFNWLSHNQTLLGRMVFCDPKELHHEALFH